MFIYSSGRDAIDGIVVLKKFKFYFNKFVNATADSGVCILT